MALKKSVHLSEKFSVVLKKEALEFFGTLHFEVGHAAVFSV
jgi:hypothetical protein